MCRVIALFFLFFGIGNSQSEKRLILHSEMDISQEFARVNKRIDDQAQHIENLTKTVAEKDKEIEVLKEKVKKIETLQQSLQNLKESSSTYVRWGRTTCPSNDTDLVYHGYMASTAYASSGGGSNFLCLSPDPQWSYYDESITSLATIKGVEYEFYAHHADGAAKFFGHDVYNDDAVCAVCHSRRSSSLMIPGRNECYSGWTKEYSGYLVSEYDTATHESDFICLDDRPESVVGGKNDDDESLLYFVEASCGKSLECPPYINGRELTCVVCTK
ncbi:uncharacterized protein LOC123540904 isoform X1 [Mercenaria mercenaria]|uniref:uncharacterized protein LOC123540904 isoform X1 n=1 Tax=Mercenaria mercenaria TaxID=6596 RepID=UPI00234E87DC|nr:uncharacterized protein LOC123540904 isoform X1 [Mercenaria mercenaria]